MKIDISYKNITPDEPLKIFIEDKIGNLERFIGYSSTKVSAVGSTESAFGQTKSADKQGPIEARVEIGLPSKHHRSGPIYYAEVNLKIGGKLLRATCQHEDMRNAIVDVKNELQREIKKFKEKKRDLSRKSGE